MEYRGYSISCRMQKGVSCSMQGQSDIAVAKISKNKDYVCVVFGHSIKDSKENAKNKIDELYNNKAMGDAQ